MPSRCWLAIAASFLATTTIGDDALGYFT